MGIVESLRKRQQPERRELCASNGVNVVAYSVPEPVYCVTAAKRSADQVLCGCGGGCLKRRKRDEAVEGISYKPEFVRGNDPSLAWSVRQAHFYDKRDVAGCPPCAPTPPHAAIITVVGIALAVF